MPDLLRPAAETRDANPRAIMWFALGLVGVLIVVSVSLHYFQVAFQGSAAALPEQPLSAFGTPPLQTAAAADLAKFRAEEESKLHAYAWINRRDGVIRLPIERAMELTVERGLPARPLSKGAAP
jgi:hypothetical protein